MLMNQTSLVIKLPNDGRMVTVVFAGMVALGVANVVSVFPLADLPEALKSCHSAGAWSNRSSYNPAIYQYDHNEHRPPVLKHGNG